MADWPVTSGMASSITEGSAPSTGTSWPPGDIVKTSPVEPVQYCDVPGPSVAAPTAQLDAPAGPPVPASVTTRPARVSTRCLGALSLPCTTVSWIPAGVAPATAGTAPAPARDAASTTTTAAVAICRIVVPFARQSPAVELPHHAPRQPRARECGSGPVSRVP